MTTQVSETLILNGKKIPMDCYPPLPENDPRIVELKALQADDFYDVIKISSTACWRRYIGTWEIKKGKFYLASIKGILKLSQDEPILADWFTGSLTINQGKKLSYLHIGYPFLYEQEVHIKIKNGIVTELKTIDNRSNDIN